MAPPSKLQVDSSGWIGFDSWPCNIVLGVVSPWMGCFRWTDISVFLRDTAKSFPRIPVGTGNTTVTSSSVCVQRYLVVTPPFPIGTCFPSSVKRISSSTGFVVDDVAVVVGFCVSDVEDEADDDDDDDTAVALDTDDDVVVDGLDSDVTAEAAAAPDNVRPALPDLLLSLFPADLPAGGSLVSSFKPLRSPGGSFLGPD